MKKVDLDWSKLSFSYIKTDKRYISRYKDGKWDEGKLVDDNKVTISESSTVLHYGQSTFEGLKAFETKDGKIRLFRPDQNAERMKRSCERIMMPVFPVERFIEACKQVIEANRHWVPPYGTGASLYLRPFLFGVGDNLGVKPAPEFIFSIFVCPVGPYFKGGMNPVNFIVSDYDRAAPNGTGAAKVGGNYAGSLLPHEYAVKEGFADCIYLDPATHTKIEEVGAANFFGITKDNKFVTPISNSILPSVTKYSLLHIAKEYLNMEAEERDVFVDKLDEFAEAGACGTAAVISPIGAIKNGEKVFKFYDNGQSVGPVTKKLYDTLTGMQLGDIEAPEGWIVEL
ncbi:MAG: branched chain amino acid aminotransferase [Candidatus Cloacimonadota bacterium]|nr:MAG: branched chain amino acid aminotransferase [Candidatus Cloacimonadota bacterium]PIE81118.1 MAG: branched chain amino acid aminotransferase [Candidatus Delongbacteria bacterium]